MSKDKFKRDCDNEINKLTLLKKEISEKLKEVCLFCGEKAEYLCDYKIGYNKEINPIYKKSEQAFTCDAPLCNNCLSNKSEINLNSHYFGEHNYTIDWCCRGHAAYKGGLKPLTVNEAKAIRTDHYNKYRNSNNYMDVWCSPEHPYLDGFNEDRMDVIGQNGNDGECYE